MSTKTSNPKTISTNGRTSKNGKFANGTATKAAKREKSIRERWIEKYGVDDSPTAEGTLKLWQMVYDANNKPKS
jgi:hypothetical protein